MKIALCQINTITGNISCNLQCITREIVNASAQGAELAIFPEMAITGYPPKDLLEYQGFIEEAASALSEIQSTCAKHNVDCIVGTVHSNIFGGKKELVNAAAFVPAKGDIQYTFKKLLPTYDVFDEHRYFQPCPVLMKPPIVAYPDSDIRIGISICEDIWNDNEFWKDERLYEINPIESLIEAGANLIVNVSASPYVSGKPVRRFEMLRHTAKRWNAPVLIVNQVGGCDQVIFDGGSLVVLPDGNVPCCAGWFKSSTEIWDTASNQTAPGFQTSLDRVQDAISSLHDALALGLCDYLGKTHFDQVLVGNSGGIDSAVVLALCTSALGPEKVISVSMPGPYTSNETKNDSALLASNLRIRHVEVPILEPFHAFHNLLHSPGSSATRDLLGSESAVSAIADENIQARLRGNILMWFSNAIVSPRTLVVSTGNKSEIAVGYCTLYGDMAGGLALISDVPKMMVYRLAHFLNSRMNSPIPQSILDREPSAELAPGQKDSDSLPPYPVLDEIIRLYVEEKQSPGEIVSCGVAAENVVQRVIRMIDNNEYKRAQAAPGLKVTSKAFGYGRRMPIARG
jgi:NAD+ synthase (glutamine-hydrolysing)